MTETLLISEPVAPPWSHEARALVRDLVRHCPDVRHRVLSTEGHRLDLDHVTEEAVYPAAAESDRWEAGWLQDAKLLARLVRPDAQAIYHVFLPLGHRTTRLVRSVLAVKKRTTVQTVLSCPDADADLDDLLFADRVVALSELAAARLRAAGRDGVVHIPPGIAPPVSYDSARRLLQRSEFGFAADRPAIVYAGPLGGTGGARAFAAAIELLAPVIDLTFAYVCPVRDDEDERVLAELRARLSHLVERRRVRFVADVGRRRELFSAADLIVDPSTSTQGRLDIPRALLEAMAERTPVLVADVAPLNEILGTAGRAPPSPVGRSVAPHDAETLASAIAEMICDPTGLSRMGHAARLWVDDRYHARSMGAAHALLYLSLEED